MNIEQIRAEIPKAFKSPVALANWIVSQGTDTMEKYGKDYKAAASILVDWAYQAGLEQAKKNDALSLENVPNIEYFSLWMAGYESGKADGYQKGYSECDADIEFNKKDQYNLGYRRASLDPKAWYVLDKNGEKVHIGDTVILSNGKETVVQGLNSNGIFSAPEVGGLAEFGNARFEKVIYDSRERIKDDLSDIILHAMKSGRHFDGIDPEASANLNADEFISRILNQWSNTDPS